MYLRIVYVVHLSHVLLWLCFYAKHHYSSITYVSRNTPTGHGFYQVLYYNTYTVTNYVYSSTVCNACT